MAFQKMSESVYVGLCHEIGTPQQVASRRNRTDDWELLLNQVLKDECKLQIMLSGSQKEGFRFRSSDIDIMYWPTNLRVIWDFSQIQFDNIQRHVPVISDSSLYFCYHWNVLNLFFATFLKFHRGLMYH